MSRTWTNWAGNVRSTASAWHEPGGERELAVVVREAARAGARVQVVGSGHSCSRIAAPDGARLVSLTGMRRALAVRPDPDRATVTVQGGMRLWELNELLAGRGLALETLGAISEQTVAGAISTGTHGTGLGVGGLAQLVLALRLVTASGETLELSADRCSDVFAAARVGLGALGVISEATLACVPAFDLRLVEAPARLGEVLDRLEEWNRADHFGLWWLPHTDLVRVRAAIRLQPGRGRRSGAGAARPASSAIYGLALRAVRRRPDHLPFVHRALGRMVVGPPRARTDRSDRVLAGAVPPRQCTAEVGVPLDRAREAIARVDEILRREAPWAHFPVDVRFTAADDAWLSPAYGRPTCYLGLVARLPGSRLHEAGFARAGAALASLDGRPHWGKLHGWSASALRACHPRLGDFLAVRRELDPAGVFLNPHLERLLEASPGAPAPPRAG